MTAPPAARWVEELARFLRREPGVSALRIDAAAHKVAVATVGQIDLQDFESRLAETIAAIEADLASRQGRAAPAGFSLRREGDALVLGRDSCVTAEKLWLWREMEWPEIRAETGEVESEWRLLASLAAACGALGVAGGLAEYLLPGAPALARLLFGGALVAGGWDAAIDTWKNIKDRAIDIHFLMLAVAVGAVAIGAWAEAVILLFLFSTSGAMEE